MEQQINILAISGSLRATSSNAAIIHAITGIASPHVLITLYDGMAQLPHFNPELDTDTPPETVIDLREQLQQAGAVLICTPEYAFGVPGSLKNLLDWTVSSGDFVDKPVALITASSSGQYAHPSLLLTLGALSAKVAEDAQLLIPFIRTKVNNDGQVTDSEVLASLQKVLDALVQTINS